MPVRTTKARAVPSQLKPIPKLHMAISAHCPHCGTPEISQSCPDLICWRCKSPLYIQSCVMPELPVDRRNEIDTAVDRAVGEYGPVFKKLAKE